MGISPRVAIFDGGYVGAIGGMGVVMTSLLPEVQRLIPDRCTIVTADGRRLRFPKNSRRSGQITQIRRRALHELQEHTPLPVLRWLIGSYDVYNYIGLAMRPRVPYRSLILSIHDLGGERWADESSYPDWAAEVIPRAKRIITVSKFVRSELCSHFSLPPDQVEVIYNGCDHERFHPASEDEDTATVDAAIGHSEACYVFSAGGVTERKNIHRLLHAFAQFHATTGSHVRLVVSGVDPQSRSGAAYRVLANEIGLGKHFILPGYLPASAMPALFRRATAVVVPSLYEGFGLPVIEAMASGTPVLASDAASLPEIAGGAALCVDATSVDALATGLERICTDQPLRYALRHKGLDRAAAFTWERCARQTIAIYRDVAAQANCTVSRNREG